MMGTCDEDDEMLLKPIDARFVQPGVIPYPSESVVLALIHFYILKHCA